MATFATLKSNVLVNVIDAPTAIQNKVGTLVNQAITKLQAKHNFDVMRATFTATTAEPSTTLAAIPADWKEWRDKPYYTENLGRTKRIRVAPSLAEIYQRLSTTDTGAPRFILEGDKDTAGAGSFIIAPIPDNLSDYPDGEYRVTIPYWKYLPVLSADGDSNWFTNTDAAIEWIEAQATARGFQMDWNEKRADYWRGIAKEFWADILLQDKYRQLAGVDTMVPHKGALEAMLDD